MPDAPNTPPTPPMPPAKPKRTRGPVDQRLVTELTDATELAATAAKPEYATQMASEGIDDTFLTGFTKAITDTQASLGLGVNRDADKQAITRDEEADKQALLDALAVIQKRAKRKYTQPKDPGLNKYYVNQGIGDSRSLLETASANIIETLKTDELPHLKPEEVQALKDARAAYVAIQTDQTGAQSDASGARSGSKSQIKTVRAMRRDLQLAADILWPPGKAPENAAIRKEFQLPPDKALA